MASRGKVSTAARRSFQDLILRIIDTALGQELICASPYGTFERVLGKEFASAHLDDIEDITEGSNAQHDGACALSRFNETPYDCFRQEPCTCKRPHKEEQALMSALDPQDKLLTLSTLIEYGHNVLQCIPYIEGGGWYCSGYRWCFLHFSQKLDDIAVAICRSIMDSAEAEESGMSEVNQAFDALLKAHGKLHARFHSEQHVYFFESLACLAKCHTESANTKAVTQNIVASLGVFSQEIVDMVAEAYVQEKAKEREAKQETYYDTIKSR